MASNETIPEREETMVALAEAAVAKQREYIHGDAFRDVATDNGPVPTIAKQARLHLEALPDAVAELSAQMTDGKIHDSEALGRQAVVDGAYFYAKSTNPLVSRSLYRRLTADTSEHVVDDPSAKSVQEVRDRFGSDEGVVLRLKDRAGFAGLEIKHESIKTRDLELSTERLQMGSQGFRRTDRAALVVIDKYGFAGYVLPNAGVEGGGDPTPSNFSAADIARENLKGMASSAAVAREYNAEVARPIWDYNHIQEYGQSLSTAYEGWPALSKAARYGNVMLGGSVRPASRTAGAFTPVGTATLQPLKAVVQDAGSGATVLTDEEVAALAPGAGNEGEACVVGMVNFAKKLHNQRLQVANDNSRTFVATCSGVAGQPIEKLSKGDATNRWLRLTQAAEKVKAIAVGEGKSYGLVGVIFLQGEFNYRADWGGVVTREEYKQKLSSLYDDFENDVVNTISGQEPPPLFMTYQTGASYTSDQYDLAIGMAQWELSEERANWVLATPVYPYPDKGGHLTSNGYRWVSKQFAKVWHRVVELGQNWKPLSPLVAQVKGREALVTFHVPHPPLAFDTPIVGRTVTDYPAKGFSALDSNGTLGIAAVTIAADCVVLLAFTRDPVGPVFIRYADKTTHNGNGCLRDSDPTVSDDIYEYTAGSGQYADENIAALVGKPYPLHNWCIAFHIPAVGA